MGEENTEWNFKDDDNINVFTYLSCFGSGEFSLSKSFFSIQNIIRKLLKTFYM